MANQSTSTPSTAPAPPVAVSQAAPPTNSTDRPPAAQWPTPLVLQPSPQLATPTYAPISEQILGNIERLLTRILDSLVSPSNGGLSVVIRTSGSPANRGSDKGGNSFNDLVAALESFGAALGKAAGYITQLSGPLSQAGRYDEQLNRFIDRSDFDPTKKQELNQSLSALAKSSGEKREDILAAYDVAYRQLGYRGQDALDATLTLSNVSTATSTSLPELAELVKSMRREAGIKGDDSTTAMQQLAILDNRSDVKVADLTTNPNQRQLSRAAAEMGLRGKGGLSALLALEHVSARASGSSSEGISDLLSAFQRTLFDQQAGNQSASGIDVQATFQASVEAGKNPLTELLQQIATTYNFDLEKEIEAYMVANKTDRSGAIQGLLTDKFKVQLSQDHYTNSTLIGMISQADQYDAIHTPLQNTGQITRRNPDGTTTTDTPANLYSGVRGTELNRQVVETGNAASNVTLAYGSGLGITLQDQIKGADQALNNLATRIENNPEYAEAFFAAGLGFQLVNMTNSSGNVVAALRGGGGGGGGGAAAGAAGAAGGAAAGSATRGLGRLIQAAGPMVMRGIIAAASNPYVLGALAIIAAGVLGYVLLRGDGTNRHTATPAERYVSKHGWKGYNNLVNQWRAQGRDFKKYWTETLGHAPLKSPAERAAAEEAAKEAERKENAHRSSGGQSGRRPRRAWPPNEPIYGLLLEADAEVAAKQAEAAAKQQAQADAQARAKANAAARSRSRPRNGSGSGSGTNSEAKSQPDGKVETDATVTTTPTPQPNSEPEGKQEPKTPPAVNSSETDQVETEALSWNIEIPPDLANDPAFQAMVAEQAALARAPLMEAPLMGPTTTVNATFNITAAPDMDIEQLTDSIVAKVQASLDERDRASSQAALS